MTLTSGVYKFDTAAQLTGELTLDAEGDPDAAFIFQIGSTLTTANASSIVLINEAQYCRVFWQVGSSATLGTDSSFIGHIFAMTSITATTGAEIQGQLLARTGAVTLDSNIITNGVCAAVTPPPVVVDEEDEPDEPTETPNPPAIVTPPAVVAPTPTPVAIVTTPAPVAVDVAADADVPQTGVSNSSGLFIGLMLLSVAGVVAATRVRSKAR
jgi:type VI secretion system secreted protein VgrG